MNSISLTPLPNNQEAEMAVLGGMLLNEHGLYTALSLLESSDFSVNKNKIIFSAISELARQEKAVNEFSLLDYLKNTKSLESVDGFKYIDELANFVPTSEAITHFCQIVKEKSVLRKLIHLTNQINKKTWEETESPETLIETAQHEIYEIGLDFQNQKGQSVYGPQEISQKALATATTFKENPEKSKGIETGFPTLDVAIRGLKDINIVSASTGIGKTAFALNLAIHLGVHQGTPTLYINHEMNIEELLVRIQGILSGVPIRNILTGQYNENYTFQKIEHCCKILKDSNLHITDNKSKNINAINCLIRKYKTQHNTQVVILDYLGEIDPDSISTNETDYETYGRWVQTLKNICTSLGIKLVLLAQLNREGETTPNKSKIGGSWKIAQKADVFLVLGLDERKKHFLKIDKNRNGPAPQTIALGFDKETQRMFEI